MSIFSNGLVSAGLRSSITRNPMQGSMVSEGLRKSPTRNPMQGSMVRSGLNDNFGGLFGAQEKNNSAPPINMDTLNILESVLSSSLQHYRSGLNQSPLGGLERFSNARSFFPTGLFSREG